MLLPEIIRSTMMRCMGIDRETITTSEPSQVLVKPHCGICETCD